MEKSVGVSPIITWSCTGNWRKILGIVGMIISIPTVITLQVVFKHFVFEEVE